ncbi:MAG TPA: hypothetical protein VII06_09995 [Chloroflexota bacterium]|jgi:hypothetical protein
MTDAKLRRTDVSNLPDALRLAEEVQRTKQAQVLERDGEELAVLTPMQSGSRRRGRKGGAAKAANPNDWLLNLIGIADSSAPADGPTDVSANKHKYLAETLYGKTHPTADR